MIEALAAIAREALAAIAREAPAAIAREAPAAIGFSDVLAFALGLAGAAFVLRRRASAQVPDGERLAQAEQLRLVLEAGQIGSWSVDAATGAVDVDSRCAEMFGLPPVENGDFRPYMERIHRDDRLPIRRSLLRALTEQAGYGASYRVCRPDGDRFLVGHGTFIAGVGAKGKLIGVNLDVTGLRQIEDDLRLSNARSMRIVEEAPLPIMLHAEDGQILFVNRAWSRISGYERDELRTIRDWAERAYGEGADAVEEVVRGVFNEKEAVDEGRYSIRTASGEERIWNFHSAPLGVIPDGRRMVMTAVGDVTDQRFARELQRSNRDLEEFAYVASHDLQEPLRMVASYLQLLSRRYEGRLDEDADKYIHYAVDGAKRMQELIKDLLVYSRAGRGNVPDTPVDTDELIADVLQTFGNRLSEVGGQVTVDPLPRLRGNRSQLRAVFQNLVENAVKYRSEEPLRIHIGATVSDKSAVLSVSDNGIGFDPSQAERIWRPFQRLHDRTRYPGNGIGLAIVDRIVDHYGGEVRAESESEGGATFFVRLPCAGPETEKPE